MEMPRVFVALLPAACLFISIPPAAGQDAEREVDVAPAPLARPAMPAPESVLTHIPADALGFIAAPNVRKALAAADAYLQRIGLGPMIQQQMPNGLLAGLRQAARLGEGFNPSGGAAVVLLNLEPFGLGGGKLFEKIQAGEKVIPPVVLLIPGASVEGVLGNYGVAGEGPRKTVLIGGAQNHAMQVGGYVALSPLAKTLDFLGPQTLKPGASMAALPKAHRAMIAGSAVAVHMDLERVGPLFVGIMEQQRREMAKQRERWEAQRQRMAEEGFDMPARPPFGPMEKALQMYGTLYGDLLKQMGPLTVTARFDPTNLILEERVSIKKDSLLGKAALAFRPGGPVAMNRLPSLPYVFAMGAAMPAAESVPATMAAVRDMQATMIKALGGGSEEMVAKLNALTERMYRNLRSIQLVAGGAPAGSGVFGLSAVYRCENAKQLRADVRESIELTNQWLGGMEMLKDQKFRLAYQQGVETVGERKVDAVDIQFPALTTMQPDERQQMTQALGEDKLRLLIATRDANTVVLTFGGSTAFLAEALKAAGGQGGVGGQGAVPQAPGVAKMLKLLPEKRMFEGVFSVTNLVQAILAGAKHMGVPPDEMPPIQMADQPPIVMGGTFEGADVRYLVGIPDGAVREMSKLFMMFVMPMRMGVGPTQPGDF